MRTEILRGSEKSQVLRAMNGQAPQRGRFERILDKQPAGDSNRKTLYYS
jgi:hypothetical protein